MRPAPDTATTELQGHTQTSERLKAEYQEAVRTNTAAKRRYDAIASQNLPTPKALNCKYGTEKLLDQRLELLEQQNHHANLVGLKDQLEAVTASGGLAAVEITSRKGETLNTNSAQIELGSLADSVSSSIQALELAVVQAHHEARREKVSLERTKSSATDQANETLERRSSAMLAVRKELTAWLERNLDRCQEEHSVLEDGRALEVENNDPDWEAIINGQYEQYLVARRRLLAAVANLRTPLPRREPKATNGEESSKEQRSRSPRDSKLAEIEQTLLPNMQQERTMEAYSRFATARLGKEVTITTNLLDRLSDESQLLQAFPLLNRSGAFEQARSAFGEKRNVTEDKIGDEVTKRLEPWLFATEAVDVASTDIAQNHLQQANEAINTVSRSLLELQLLQETRP